MVGGEGEVGVAVLFRENLDGREMRGEAGAVELVGLFGLITFRDEDEAMSGGEVGKS